MRRVPGIMFAAAMIAGVAAGASVAGATVMNATYSGVVSDGTDVTGGIFAAPGADLTGSRFTLRFTYDPDTAGAARSTGLQDESVYGGSVLGFPSPLLSAVLTIGSGSFYFGGAYYGQAVTQAGAGHGSVSHYVSDLHSTTDSWQDASVAAQIYNLFDGSLFPTRLHSAIFLAGAGIGGDGSFTISACTLVNGACDGASVREASGYLSVESLEITGDGATAVPVPAALPLLASALGVMGLAGWLRRRKTAG
jgi:hypothetical protein